MMEVAVFACAVTSLGVALVAAVIGFAQFVPPSAAALAESIFRFAIAAFVLAAAPIVLDLETLIAGRRISPRPAESQSTARIRVPADKI